MSERPIPPNLTVPRPNVDASFAAPPASTWDRISAWAAEHKAVVYTVAGVTLVATAAGVYYYASDAGKPAGGAETAASRKRKNKKDKQKGKREAEEASNKAAEAVTGKKATVEAEEEELPEVDESTVGNLDEETRKKYANKLKLAGNEAYKAKEHNRAIELYGKAIICRQDPVFYSNRAACWNALSQWEKVIEDTTAALSLDSEYVKALNRRANAYEQVGKYSEALLDFTASCILDKFSNAHSRESVERLLKTVAETKGKEMLANKEKRLPSPTFVTNYLQSFRPRPPPAGLEEDAELDEDSGPGQLRKGIVAMSKRTADSYAEADRAFEKALERGELGEHEAFAYNMRGTFRYLKGDNQDALEDLTQSVKMMPSLTQSFIKRASMHLEIGNRDAAADDFAQAMRQNDQDPDIYYHRAQLHFILGEFAEAAKDYQKSIDLDPSFIFSHIQLGVTQYKMGSIASSMATFRRCIKNFHDVPDVYNYYGELLLDQQKFEDAIEKFDRAVDMEKATKPLAINVLPLINKALALYQWRQDYAEAEKLCQKALIIDPECDIAVATMAQLLLQQSNVEEALKYFRRAAELSRTEGEIVNALSYAEAAQTQIEVSIKYPHLAPQAAMGPMAGAPPMMA